MCRFADWMEAEQLRQDGGDYRGQATWASSLGREVAKRDAVDTREAAIARRGWEKPRGHAAGLATGRNCPKERP